VLVVLELHFLTAEGNDGDDSSTVAPEARACYTLRRIGP
jgi:hypothetical protein